jgi:hypothetical protein
MGSGIMSSRPSVPFSKEPSGTDHGRRMPSLLAEPPIVDNDNGNPDFVVECAGDRELPVLLCECMYGMGFGVLGCRAWVQDGLTYVRLTVAESDGSALDARRRRQARALVDALVAPLSDAAE